MGLAGRNEIGPIPEIPEARQSFWRAHTGPSFFLWSTARKEEPTILLIMSEQSVEVEAAQARARLRTNSLSSSTPLPSTIPSPIALRDRRRTVSTRDLVGPYEFLTGGRVDSAQVVRSRTWRKRRYSIEFDFNL